MLNGDFPARLCLTPILTNLNGNSGVGWVDAGGGGVISMAQDAYLSRTSCFILGFRRFKSSSGIHVSFWILEIPK